MRLGTLQQELRLYEESFGRFLHTNALPGEWFSAPDHVAIKCANEEDYVATCSEIRDQTLDGVWEIELDGRFLGSAQLTESIKLAGYNFSWIEIMQPRPSKETDKGFAEHTEFLFKDFGTVQQKLEELGIAYELQQNPGHRWINIVIDELGREIKINDKVLADVVTWERDQGHLKKRGEE